MATTCDVVIVGGGLTGAFTARSMAARGLSVVLLDARPLGHNDGSSHGSSRIFRRAYADPLYAGMAARALDQWRDLESESGTTLLTTTGGLDYGKDRHVGELFETVQASGTPSELLSPEEAAERFPGMRFPTDALYHPDAGYLDPEASIRAALAVAEKDGAELRIGIPVEALERRGSGVIVTTPNGTFSARQAVLAAGAWLPELLPQVLPDVAPPDLTVTEQNVFHFGRTHEGKTWPVLVCKHDTQFFGLASGSDAGDRQAVKIGRHDPGASTTPSTRSRVPNAHTRDLIQEFVENWMPGLENQPLREDTCLYTRTRTEDFLMDRRGAITIASPCSGMGAKFAPVLGDMISDIALGIDEPHPRFALTSHS
ncbi:sarcosine oxidase [Arthrobacter sp. MYb23]|uniref:FAD-dependent oxidoreductase n=1 Tax=unclassified Arthrobacter TaxID=235627 RepID=UPI000CFACBAF|nr:MULTISPECIES: FAD-dependent oxidoreductase [unclassified Arthrobacter]PRB43129.1 sarcosine oxidase [Arthrobacter sp. MYb51]PRB98089.1 sarcosine oxidase [Arthrobacter sp. MYb23]